MGAQTEKRESHVFGIVMAVILGIVAALVVAMAVYFHQYYQADHTALEAMKGSADVSVTQGTKSYLFDGPGTENALIFYPGAKVETYAYAPLLLQIAETGTDCILADMPLHFAIFDVNAADRIMQEYSGQNYKRWFLSGHSMGGAAASMNLSSHLKKGDMPYAGMIFFASYPAGSIADFGLPVLSVYGTDDLDPQKIEDKISDLPKDADIVKIVGGNHAQFGNYGIQKGDGEAGISAEEQQKKTVDAVENFIKKASASVPALLSGSS